MVDKYKLILSGTTVVGLSMIFGAAIITQPRSSHASPVRTVSAPFNIEDVPFEACGYMGDAIEEGTVQLDFNHEEATRPNDEDDQTVRVEYKSGGSLGWAGVYWLLTTDGCNWGQEPGVTVTNATKVTFWAKGAQGGERVEFKAGGVSSRPNIDSFEVSLGRIRLTSEWRQYEMNLSDQNLSEVVGAFAWAAPESESAEMVFYLDDIRYE
jgi:hypothetical protein